MTDYDNVHTLYAFKETCRTEWMHITAHARAALSHHIRVVQTLCKVPGNVWCEDVCMLPQRIHDEVIHSFNGVLDAKQRHLISIRISDKGYMNESFMSCVVCIKTKHFHSDYKSEKLFAVLLI